MRFRLLVPVLLLAAVSAPRGAAARFDGCPFCNLPILKDTPAQDNVVTMAVDKRSISYRCVMCAIADAKLNYFRADVSITAPSTMKGQPVLVRRTGGHWTVEPATTVFVWVEGSHGECQTRYRAARSIEHFAQFVKANAKLLRNVRPLSLQEVLKRLS